MYTLWPDLYNALPANIQAQLKLGAGQVMQLKMGTPIKLPIAGRGSLAYQVLVKSGLGALEVAPAARLPWLVGLFLLGAIGWKLTQPKKKRSR